MKPFVFILLLIALIAPRHLTAQQAARATVQGRVVDAETGQPLPGAHVFLNASTRGTTTNAEGRYRLDNLPTGSPEIVASMLGFETQRRRPGITDTTTLDFRLHPIVIKLGEIVVSATRPEKWAEYLERFRPLFLGATLNAERCLVVNPEVLDFTYDEDRDYLRATAREPLIIENRALGYRVYYHLQEFESMLGQVRYLGTSRFEELEPRNKREGRRWQRRRRKAYEGSLQHFLTTLFDDKTLKKTRKAGFNVSIAPHFESDPGVTIPARSGAFMKPASKPGTHLLSFDDHLLVVYEPDLPASAPSGVPGGSSVPNLVEYASWITLNNGPTEVDRFGHLFDPYALTTFGLWSRERLADMLPRDFQPGR